MGDHPYGIVSQNLPVAVAYVTNTNDDTVSVIGVKTVTLIAVDPIASEAGLSTGAFKVLRTGDTINPLFVKYTTIGTAKPGRDYRILPGIVEIPAGKSYATVIIKPRTDKRIEGDETVIMTLKSSSDYEVGTPGTATVTIVDNN